MSNRVSSFLVPVAMRTSPFISGRHSQAVLTITDNSLLAYPIITASNYVVYQPGIMPKGPTDRFMLFEGNDIANTMDRILGTPNTSMFGPMYTYAMQAALGGFSVGTINITPDGSTYPNTYMGLHAGVAKNEDGTDKMGIMYIGYDPLGQFYHMSMDRVEIPDSILTVWEVPFPILEVKFDQYYVEGCTSTQVFENHLGNTGLKTSITPGDTVDSTNDYLHIPIQGLMYHGAGDYNSYKVVHSMNNGRIKDRYPYFHCDITDNTVSRYSFDFALFDIANDYGTNMGFVDQALSNTVERITPQNIIPMFHPFQVEKVIANGITESLTHLVAKFQNDLLKRIRAIDPALAGFDPYLAESDWDKVTNNYFLILEQFSRSNENKALETPLSFINPFDSTIESEYNNSPVEYRVVSPTFGMYGGRVAGGLDEILRDKGFSWNIMIDVPSIADLDVLDTVTISDPTPRVGEIITVTITTKKKPAEQTQFFVDKLARCYGGGVDGAVLDPAILPDAICFGEGYPQRLQEVVAEFVRYKDGWINYEGGRPDLAYIRTPGDEVDNMRKAIEWAGSLGTAANFNMHPVIGSWRFKDPWTGSQVRFGAFFDYLGRGSMLYNYLTSYTSDSFASGTFSVISSGAPGSHRLIPSESDEREELALKDVMYYGINSNRQYVLWEDFAYIPNFDSVIKTIGSSIHFNKINRLMYLYARDNKITNPTNEILNIHRNAVEQLVRAPVQHFGSRFSIRTMISQHPNEIGIPVVLYESRIQGNEYARHARVDSIIERPVNSIMFANEDNN